MALMATKMNLDEYAFIGTCRILQYIKTKSFKYDQSFPIMLRCIDLVFKAYKFIDYVVYITDSYYIADSYYI